jgi:ribokinase
MRVIVFGSLNVDTTVDVPRQPLLGETILASGASVAPGGKGANQAVASRRLGVPAVMVGCIGGDDNGAHLRRVLRDADVNDSVSVDSTLPTGRAFIFRDDQGQNSIVVVPGANSRASAESLVGIPEVHGPTALVLQLEVPISEVVKAARLGHERGWLVVLNPSPVVTLDTELLGLVDTLVANEYEAAQLAGVLVEDVASARAAAERVRAGGPTTVVVTLGAAGAVLLSGEGAWHAEAPAVDVVDTTAAGDAFIGGFIAALFEFRAAVVALSWGVAAGALSVTQRGAQPSLPSRAQTEALAAHVVCHRVDSQRSVAGGENEATADEPAPGLSEEKRYGNDHQ